MTSGGVFVKLSRMVFSPTFGRALGGKKGFPGTNATFLAKVFLVIHLHQYFLGV